jgi:hypothetical protein
VVAAAAVAAAAAARMPPVWTIGIAAMVPGVDQYIM